MDDLFAIVSALFVLAIATLRAARGGWPDRSTASASRPAVFWHRSW
jgi:hypothetical protein